MTRFLPLFFIFLLAALIPRPALPSSSPTPVGDECINAAFPPSDTSRAVGWHVINLDAPPEDRWTPLVKAKKTQIAALVKHIKTYIKELSGSSLLIDIIENKLGPLADTMRYPFGEEMKGIARAGNITLSDVVMFNVFYELFTFCTSIVAEDGNGKLYHVRNLDFGIFMGWDVKTHKWQTSELLRPLTVNLDFQRGGKTVFQSVNFAGYIGVLTGIRPHRFTFSINERFDVHDAGLKGIINWLEGDHSGHWLGFLTRQVMENATSFEEAFKALSNTKMLAPAYFILGGNSSSQGAIVTRSSGKAVNVVRLRQPATRWFLLQTNYDNWTPTPFYDKRREAGDHCMAQMSVLGTSFQGLFNVLSSQPVLNKLTVYSALMSVNDGHLETWLQDCADPCTPF